MAHARVYESCQDRPVVMKRWRRRRARAAANAAGRSDVNSDQRRHTNAGAAQESGTECGVKAVRDLGQFGSPTVPWSREHVRAATISVGSEFEGRRKQERAWTLETGKLIRNRFFNFTIRRFSYDLVDAVSYRGIGALDRRHHHTVGGRLFVAATVLAPSLAEAGVGDTLPFGKAARIMVRLCPWHEHRV